MTDPVQSCSAATEGVRRRERVAMAREICMHRGENPDKIDRGGYADWEKYEPLAGAVIREAERLFAMRAAAQGAAKPYGWHAAGNGLFTVDDLVAEVWRGHMGLDVTPLYASQPSPAATVETKFCECLGGSTHLPAGSAQRRCDLCGLPVPNSSAGNADDLMARTKEMPSSLNDACRTIELLVEEIGRLRALPQEVQLPEEAPNEVYRFLSRRGHCFSVGEREKDGKDRYDALRDLWYSLLSRPQSRGGEQ